MIFLLLLFWQFVSAPSAYRIIGHCTHGRKTYCLFYIAIFHGSRRPSRMKIFLKEYIWNMFFIWNTVPVPGLKFFFMGLKNLHAQIVSWFLMSTGPVLWLAIFDKNHVSWFWKMKSKNPNNNFCSLSVRRKYLYHVWCFHSLRSACL